MDSKFDYIDNVAAAADGDVMKKQTSPIKAIVLLVVGAGILLIVRFRMRAINNDE